MVRRIAIGVDQAAFPIRETISKYVRDACADAETLYLGPSTAESVDYPDFALRVAELVSRGEVDCGILLCGTGIGMSIAANKVPGVRAALCHDHFTAFAARTHNNANILCAGERTTGLEVIREMINTFLQTPFSGEERHARRIEKIAKIETRGK